MNYTDIIILFAASLYVLVLPGLVFSYAFFSHREIGLYERFMLSFGISFSLVPLSIYLGSVLGIHITPGNVLVEIGLLIIIGLMGIILKYIIKEYV